MSASPETLPAAGLLQGSAGRRTLGVESCAVVGDGPRSQPSEIEAQKTPLGGEDRGSLNARFIDVECHDSL